MTYAGFRDCKPAYKGFSPSAFLLCTTVRRGPQASALGREALTHYPRNERLCRWTSSTNSATASGGVKREMPCPRLNTCPLLPTGPNASSTRRASVRMASPPQNSAMGSRLPWNATESPVRRRQVHGPVQADRVAAAGSDLFQPLPAALGEHNDRHAAAFVLALQARDHLAGIRQRKLLEQAIGQPQLSNSMTAWAPASICAFRYCSVAWALISRM